MGNRKAVSAQKVNLMRPEHWIYTLPLRLRSLFRRPQVDQDLDEEIRDHLERRTDEYVAKGLSLEEARYAARREFGGVEQAKEKCRDTRKVNWIYELVQDLRYGLRQMRRNPGFTAVAVITLALGIGANTAVFSVVRAVLLSRLPYSDPDRLVCITDVFPGVLPSSLDNLVADPDYLHWRGQNQVFQFVAAYGQLRGLNLGSKDELERVDATDVTWDFFPMLGVRPALGRSFLPEEDRPGGPPIVMLSHSLWQRRFRSDPKLVGKVITLNEKGYTVIGIMPESFHFPADWGPELFVPLDLEPNLNWDSPSFGGVYVIARLKPGVKLSRATSDLVAINRRSDKALPPPFSPQMHDKSRIGMVTLHERLLGDVRPLLLILLGAVGFVLLLACANVANLQLARAAMREKEFAVQAAIGAGRWRLARQLLVESFALAVLGGVAGLILGAGGVALFRHLRPPNIPGLTTVGLDGWVFAFIAAITASAGIASGLAPVFVASGLNLDETLKESGPRTTTGGAAQRLRALLMVSEVALALVLLTGAGLLIRSFVRLASVDPGFDPQHLLTERVLLPLEKYPNPAQWATFFQSVLERVGGLPSVESAAAAEPPPLTNAYFQAGVEVEGRPGWQYSDECIISPSYFHTLRIPLISGRDFTPYDAGSASRATIVNEVFARRFFGQEDPVGHRIRIGETWHSIVGVVRSTRHLPLTTEPSAEVFTCGTFWSMTLVVRAASDPASLAAAVRSKVQAVDPNQPVYDVATMEERFSQAVAPQRFNALVMAIFAVMAVILAGVGVYGVMAYSVTRRTHEIGVRMALGAQRQDVLKLVLRQGALLVAFGIGLGVAGALALTRSLSSLLYGVKPTDPLTFVGVALVLISVALMASYIPARRATKVDPMVALRHE
jgi:putative ABC transport system permease protein